MASEPRPGSLAARLGQTSSIIVVEDEPDIATFLGAFFRASGTEVVHIDPGAASEVVELAVRLGAACALVDLNLGGLSGFEVLEALRDDARLKAMPVVIVTADSRPATREQAVGLGAAAFIAKPFNVKDLFATVRALVEGDPLLDEQSAEVASGDAVLRRGALRGGVLPADLLHRRLDDAIDAAEHRGGPVTFALVRVVAGGAGQDAVGAELATLLGERVGGAEVLGSSAPDELAVLFPTDDAPTVEAAVSGALGDTTLSLKLPAGRTVNIACAVGIASAPEHAATGDELYMAADVALAEAVESGRPVVTAR